MLRSLYIQNYALIEKLDISFGAGFSVITGETGAGKSIILGAIGLLLGQRAEVKAIRQGASKCVIEARFDISAYGMEPFFEDNELEYEEECILRREVYALLVQQVTDLHLNKLEELFVVNLVALVHEYNNVRNTNLTGEEDVLTGLRHRAVSSGNDEDSAVHLCSTGDHVLNIVSMARAVNVSVVTLVRFILNVSGVDRDTTLSLFRSLIDHGVILELCLALQSENLRDSSSKSSLTMVNVTDCTDVYMGLISFELSLCHWNCLLLFSKITF